MSAPWTWLQHDEPDAITPFTIGDADDNDIAQVFSSECSTVNVTLEQARANARLMAAAPDLLAALQDALSGWRYIRSNHGDRPGVGWDRVETAARAAIAAATGEPA